jgi:hypothetical protein
MKLPPAQPRALDAARVWSAPQGGDDACGVEPQASPGRAGLGAARRSARKTLLHPPRVARNAMDN